MIMDISNQEIYLRILIVIIGIAISIGGVVLEGIVILKILEFVGGGILIITQFLRSMKPWR